VSEPESPGGLVYTLYVGGEGDPHLLRCEALLLDAGISLAAASEADLLATPDIQPPRLVILDHPGSRAERLASLRRLQSISALVGVPVALLASDADIDSYSEAITAGVSAYLVRPVKPEELLEVTRRLSGWTGLADRTERRRRLRRPLLMRVELVIRSTKARLPGQMLDVSVGGCRVEVDQQVPQGELVRVILHANDASTHVALGGEVRWHSPGEPGRHQLGVRFSGTTALLAGKLLGFVSTGMT
jgi:DNA-binding response OmpR family regulator